MDKVTNRRISNEEALAIFVEAKLSKRSYYIIRRPCKDVYPPYNAISETKTKCYPPRNFFGTSEVHCKVQLQALLNHTCERLLELQSVDELKQSVRNGSELKLYLKYGFDGSTFGEYKQKFSDSSSSDASVFLTSIVPLRLNQNETILWENPRPSSTKHCRPVCLQLIKETTDETIKEHKRMEKEIENLVPFSYSVGDYNLSIQFQLIMTMIDGKTINAITGKMTPIMGVH